uniref:Uncharacterized protein n=1 Tax=Fervidicoccus fontis TaxID=683846 RepID=A0A7J3ZI76_9CREN
MQRNRLKPLRLPPKIKVLEALSAVADKRVLEVTDNEAIVRSSDGSRSYEVFVDLEAMQVYSSDNGTIYRGYIGYPIIAFMMKRGTLPYDPDVADKLKGINWRKLNEQYKKYTVVEKIVKNIFSRRNGDLEKLEALVNRVMQALKHYNLVLKERPE